MSISWGAVLLILLSIAGIQPVLADAQTETSKETFTVQPKVMQTEPGVFHCDSAPLLLVGKSLEAKDADAYRPLQARLNAVFGTSVAATKAEHDLPSQPFILIGLVKDHPALRKLESDLKPRLPKHGLGEEGYLLEVRPEHILVTADHPAGVFYGVLQLLDMTRQTGTSLEVSGAQSADWPTMAWRGMHVSLGSRNSLPAVEQLLTQYLPQLRINKLILEVDYHFQFQSHPEVAEADSLSVADCRHLTELARQNFIEITPMINCLGHQSWAAHTAQFLKAHPEFDETPEVPADNKGIYCRSWCPMHPDINKVVFALFDELIDAFQAHAFNVGMDEVFLIGKCPRCKDETTAALFAKAVNDCHAHLVGKKKVQMMMWGDRLLDATTMGYGEWESSANGTAPAIDLIPKDIVICDWHYETPADFPSVKYFQDKGLRVWPSGWRTVENARRLANCALHNQSNKMVGYLATTWVGVDAVANGLGGNTPIPTGRGRRSDLAGAIREGMKLAWQGSEAVASAQK
jgi:hypothetical protein